MIAKIIIWLFLGGKISFYTLDTLEAMPGSMLYNLWIKTLFVLLFALAFYPPKKEVLPPLKYCFWLSTACLLLEGIIYATKWDINSRAVSIVMLSGIIFSSILIWLQKQWK